MIAYLAETTTIKAKLIAYYRGAGAWPGACRTDNDDFSRNAETLPHESNGIVESNKKHMATMCHLCKIFSRSSGKEFVVEWLEFNGHRFLSSSENKGLLKSRNFAPACSASWKSETWTSCEWTSAPREPLRTSRSYRPASDVSRTNPHSCRRGNRSHERGKERLAERYLWHKGCWLISANFERLVLGCIKAKFCK